MNNIRRIVLSTTPPPTDCLWITENHVAKAFINGSWVVIAEGADSPAMKELESKIDSMDKEIGDLFKALGSTQGIISLEVGNSAEIKSRNLSKLKTVQNNNGDNTFFVDISYGYGTGTWNTSTGGKAFIFTAGGIAKVYTISSAGEVTAGKEVDLSNPNTEIFKIVTELPEASTADKGKIYCVKSTSVSSQAIEAKNAVVVDSNENAIAVQAETAPDTLNRYIEYIAIEEEVDGSKIWDWEKVGEFKAEPDLSSYAKLSGATFTGSTKYSTGGITIFDAHNFGNIQFQGVLVEGAHGYIQVGGSKSTTTTYATGGSLIEVGNIESFTFTLEDGSTVTKEIRVLSTTNS